MKKELIFMGLLLFIFSLGVNINAQNVSYSGHLSGIGWTGYYSNGETCGTTGQSRQMEAIKVRVNVPGVQGGIRYNVHAADVGWLGWSFNDEQAGTTGQNRRIEAVRIQLTGDLAQKYDVWYRVHAADLGWTGWSVNGDDSGTTGQARRIEAIQIRLDARPDKDKLAEEIAGQIKDISDVSVRVVDEGITISLDDIQFQPDSAVMLPGESVKLDKIVEILLRYQERNILVSGHTALAGTEEGRRQLSTERASTVANYLIAKNARSSDRIVVRGYGSDRPLADNSTEEGRRRNRRVEVTLLEN